MSYRLKNTVLVSLLASTILLTPNDVDAQADTADMRLKLTQVELYIRSEQIKKAFAILEELKQQHPNHPDVLLAEAEASLHAGFTTDGIELLEEAHSFDPHNEAIQEYIEEVRLSRASFIGAERKVEMSGDTELEQVTRINGQYRYDRNYSAGMNLENNRIRVASIRRVNGVVQRVEDDKQRGEFFIDYENDYTIRGSIFGAEDNVGAGGIYGIGDLYGKTEIKANFNKPDWNYTQNIVDNGTRHNVGLSRMQRLAPNLIGNVGAAYNMYNLDGESDVAKTTTVDAGLSYIVPAYSAAKSFLGSDTFISLAYGMNAEYAHTKERSAGVELLPITSYEIHSATVNLSKEIIPELDVGLYGGYAYDRLGEEGATFGGSLSYTLAKKLEAELSASRSVSTENTGEEFDVVSFALKRKF